MKKNMKPRNNRSGLQGSERRSLIQSRPLPCTSQTTFPKPFTGKVFYLDLASNRVAETLENDIKDLGGTVEKFFSKEIKYLISNKREAKYVQCLRQDSPIPSPESGPSSPQPCSKPHQLQSHGDSTKSTSQPQKDAVATSRGKSLVKRVIKEQERIQLNKILLNALDWGVKILYLDDVITYVQKKKKTFGTQYHLSTVKSNIKAESTKQVFQKSKGGRITKPFVKVEDSSRHYRPFYLRLTNIPEFNLATAPPCTPFCAEDKGAPGNKHYDHRGRASATDDKPNERKKKKQGGYCECCLVKYDNITDHLQSDQHKAFAKSNEYLVVDKLVSAMCCNFTHIRSKLKRRRCSLPVLIASGPFADKPRHEDVVDSVVNVERLLSSCKHERRTDDEFNSELGSKVSCPAPLVIQRTNKRQKRHKPKPLCDPEPRAEGEQDPYSQEELAPPTGDRVSDPPALSEVQLSNHHSVLKSQEPTESQSVVVGTRISPEILSDTKLKATTLESSLCGLDHSGSLAHRKKTDNFVFQTYNSSEDFVPVERIQRKIKVYKRKRRKVAKPVVSEYDELKDAAKDGFTRLWELFQASDDMDLEFYGFE